MYRPETRVAIFPIIILDSFSGASIGWKEFDRVSQREEFAHLAVAEGVKFSRLCERFGVSRKIGYKWRERHRASAEEPPVDRSRKPH
ncbi:transposase [Novipirellula sp.]|uniref:transposase n=1 Tax=Novipirellula sp. TaxID=2795430 RepID=UPI00356AB6D4